MGKNNKMSEDPVPEKSITVPSLIASFLNLLGLKRVNKTDFGYPASDTLILWHDKADGKLKYRNYTGENYIINTTLETE